MLTTREQLIQWAAFCDGRAGALGKLDDEWSRARAMMESVDEATRTPADRIRFYLRFVVLTWRGAPTTPRARWYWLHHQARMSNRKDDAHCDSSLRDRGLERLVFELTQGL
jgi:hypothetical protein